MYALIEFELNNKTFQDFVLNEISTFKKICFLSFLEFDLFL